MFAGPPRHSDVGSFLREFLPSVELVELDLLRDRSHDLSNTELWDRVFFLVQQPRTAFITSPPCHTFSRAHHRKPGPPPLKSRTWLRGFPWLSDKFSAEVEMSNFLIDQSLRASILAADAGNPFLWEHPKNLGLAADGVVPASIWAWPEMLDMITRTSAVTFAFWQCSFGSPSAKPTRFVTTLEYFKIHKPPFATLPRFDANSRYLGPLPKQCPHGSHPPLIGKDPQTQAWRTSPSASYPPALCRRIAEAVTFSLSEGAGPQPAVGFEKARKPGEETGAGPQPAVGFEKARNQARRQG